MPNRSVQVALPVDRHAAPWSGRRLIERMMRGRSERRSVGELVGAVVPEPVLTGLETLNHRVAALRGVAARVLGGRGITAADVAATRAPPQVKPPTTVSKALDTSGRARRNRGSDHAVVGHSRTLIIAALRCMAIDRTSSTSQTASGVRCRDDRAREGTQSGRRGAKARA
jgi:hypothetical protein